MSKNDIKVALIGNPNTGKTSLFNQLTGLKQKVGNYMETHVAKVLPCPSCNKKELKVLGNHSPSLDLVCSNCSRKIEVKSKLSVSFKVITYCAV